MDFHVEQIVSPVALRAIREAGLHKVAAAMLGVDEINMKVAVAALGAKAYIRRKEAANIEDGLKALAAARGEKTANWTPLLARMVIPALGGAGVAALPVITRPGPINHDELMRNAVMGAIGGGALGGIGALGQAGVDNPAAMHSLMQTVGAPRVAQMPHMPPAPHGF